MSKMKFYFLWLSLVLIGVFLLQMMIQGFTDIFVLNDSVFSGQLWRLVSAIFLHGSLTHLLFNLFALLFFGLVLEKLIGSKNFLIVFFVSGIFANLVAVNFYESSLGASGAIYGVIGCVSILRPMMMVWAFGLIVPMFVASIIWVAADILRILGFNPGNVGSVAHLSGIGIGLLFGFFLRFYSKKESGSEKLEIPDSYIEDWENRYIR
jgi:uncharacterized protein